MSKSLKHRLLLAGAGIGIPVLTALGWMLGTAAQPAAGANGGKIPNHRKASAAHTEARARASVAHRQVAGIRRGETAEQRLRATIELATSLAPSEFAEWMEQRWFDHRNGFELTLFRRILEKRWRQEDPEGFINWCLVWEQKDGGWTTSSAREAAKEILAEWAVHSPDRLANYFAAHPNDGFEAQLIARLAAHHPELAFDRLQDILAAGANDRINELRAAVFQIAKHAPESIAAILDDLPSSLRTQAETAVIGARLSASFHDEVRSLWGRADGWELFSKSISLDPSLGNQLLGELANLPADWIGALGSNLAGNRPYVCDPESWYQTDLEGAGFSSAQADRIRSGALRVLASWNPELALELLPESALTPGERRGVISQIFHRSRSDPAQAEAWIALLGSEDDIRTARNASSPEVEAPPSPPTEYHTPNEWLQGVSAERPERQDADTFGSALQQFDQPQQAELAAQFANLPAEQRDRVARLIVDGNYSNAPELVGESVRHLLVRETAASDTSTAENETIRMTQQLAVRWTLENGPAAGAWVQSLPEGEARDWAQLNVASTWADYDPAAMEQWLGTLPADRQDEIRDFVRRQESR